MGGDRGGGVQWALDRQEDNGGITLSGVGLDAFIGTLADRVSQRKAAKQALIDQIWPLVLTPATFTAPATVDARDIYGPKDGWAWDLRFSYLAATGGTLDLYLNQPTVGGTADPGSLSHVAAAATSQVMWGSGVTVLQPGDRFVMVAGASTTSSLVVLHVIQVPLGVLGEYLM